MKMSISDQFQAADYLEHTRTLAKKDWVLKLIKMFPDGGIVNNLRVVELEQLNTFSVDDQISGVRTMIDKMEVENKQNTTNKDLHSNTSSSSHPVDLKSRSDNESKPITLRF